MRVPSVLLFMALGACSSAASSTSQSTVPATSTSSGSAAVAPTTTPATTASASIPPPVWNFSESPRSVTTPEFSLNVPTSWTDLDNEGDSVIYQVRTIVGGTSLLMVTLTRGPEGQTLQAFSRHVYDMSRAEGATMTEPQPVQTSIGPALESSLELSVGAGSGPNGVMLGRMLHAEGTGLELGCLSSGEMTAAMRTQCGTIVQSARVGSTAARTHVTAGGQLLHSPHGVVEIPADWTVLPPDDGLFRAINSSTSATLSVVLSEESVPASDASVFLRQAPTNLAQGMGGRLVSTHEVRVGTSRGTDLEISVTAPAVPLKQRVRSVASPSGRIYTIACGGSTDLPAAELTVCDSIFDSLRLLR